MAAVGLEPRTSRSGVRHSTTEPPRSPMKMDVLCQLSVKMKHKAILNKHIIHMTILHTEVSMYISITQDYHTLKSAMKIKV